MKILNITNLLIFVYIAVVNSKLLYNQNYPKWASSYTVNGVIQLPYAEIKEDFKSYYDSTNNRSRIDYYGSMLYYYVCIMN